MYNKNNTTEESYFRTKEMCTFIKMEYLVASALVELYEKKNIDKISLEDIQKYGIKVEETLLNEQINAILLYSNNYTKEFLEDYSRFFEREGEFIKKRADVTSQEIREYILAYISVNMLLVLLNKDSLSVINDLK
ncbi:MAG: hypothetical protein NC548_50045 [Lachnospiraceae bacterium]|nr:hypothetical protein [Lachnospiraceae bacterium]